MLIAGAGAIGSRLAVYLSERGDDVTVIDEDKEKCEWLSKNSDARVYNGSMLDPELLMEAGMEKMDALVIALGNDQLTRKVVDVAKSQFGVPRVVAIVQESQLVEPIASSGADKVICSQDTVLDELEKVLQNGGSSRRLYHDEKRKCMISKVVVRATSEALGKQVSRLDSKSARISGICRDGNVIFPSEDTSLEMGDEVFVIGRDDEVEKLVDLIRQEG
jgi:trk system potassium uptake protein TrkA